MSRIYDNWERLVAAVMRKQQLWELFHADSIPTSISSTSYLSINFDSMSQDYDESEGEVDERMKFPGFYSRVFGYESLLSACDEVPWVGGSVTSSYEVEMENGVTIVVKRSRGVERNSKKLNNRTAYFSHEDEKVIIYEYPSQGSEPGNKLANPISWKSRLRIAVRLAKTIALVHAKDNPKKLFLPNTEASVWDRLMNWEADDSSSDLDMDNTLAARFAIPTAGYCAPEVVYANVISQASDVYAFGVMLLDLLTGRSPLNAIGVSTMNLVRWVTSMLHEQGTLIVFEFVPARNPSELIEMWKMLHVAMSCVVEIPEQRPGSMDVVKMMEDIMTPKRL